MRASAGLILGVGIGIVGCWVVPFTGCAGGDPTAPAAHPKVLLVGIDGATWTVLDPLLAAGELPNFARLIDRGTRGVLTSERPMMSPALWTTIATGRSRAAHGITAFQLDGRLVSARDRKTSAIWQWVSAFEREVGFSGWWASWPADPVSGWFVTDRAVRNRWAEWTGSSAARHATWPESLNATVQRVTVRPEDLTRRDVAEIVDLNDAEWVEFRSATKPVFHHWLSVFKFAFANQRSYENAALTLLEAGQPDLLSVFLIASDPISHCFWHFYEPGAFDGVDPADAARLGQAIPNIYRHNDRFLGRLLDRLDDDTIVVVVSDHGFQASGVLPREVSRKRFAQLSAAADPRDVVAIGQSGKHHLDGVLILSGPGIRAAPTVEARLVDVAPTIMALLGLPVATDLEGRVLADWLDANRVPALTAIDSYEPLIGAGPDTSEIETADPELLERLRALGYVQ